MSHALKMMLLGIFLVLLSIFCVVLGQAVNAGILAPAAVILIFLGILCFVGGFFSKETP